MTCSTNTLTYTRLAKDHPGGDETTLDEWLSKQVSNNRKDVMAFADEVAWNDLW
jgi:hypothetical protein